MYHAHFGLRQEPFGAAPDSRFFLPTEQHREAVATLMYSISQRRGFSLLYGAPGLGKTSVIVKLLHMLEGKAETAFLPQPYFDSTTVLDAILEDLGIPLSGSLARNHRIFYEYLQKTHAAGKTCVVIFDEAQNIQPETLEAIRMLSNFEARSEKLIQIVMAGQPRLAQTLASPELEQFRQRFSAVARLVPLTDSQTREYIRYRLSAVGGSPDIFTPEALDLIVLAAGDVPRNINTICFGALTIAFALRAARVSPEHVEEALRDLDIRYDLPSLTPQSAEAHASRFSNPLKRSIRSGVFAAVILLAAGSSLLFSAAKVVF